MDFFLPENIMGYCGNSSDNYGSDRRGTYFGNLGTRKGTFSNVASRQSIRGRWDHKNGKIYERSHREIFRSRPHHDETGKQFHEGSREISLGENLLLPFQETQTGSQALSTVQQQPTSPMYHPHGFNPPFQATMMSPYNLYPVLNPQWEIDPSNISGMDIIQNSAAGMNPYPLMRMGNYSSITPTVLYPLNERLEQKTPRTPTPPQVVLYSEAEAALVGEKLRDVETLKEGLHILVTWFEKGECHKRNVSFFYSMVQSAYSHIRRLVSENLKHEEEFNIAKMKLKEQKQELLMQFNEIKKVFAASSLQKNWDHFTKVQRKKIETWKNDTEKNRRTLVGELISNRIEDEMELSDDDSSDEVQGESNLKDHEDLLQELKRYKEECEALRCQFEASKNEIMILQSESDAKNKFNEKQIECLKHDLQRLKEENLSCSQNQIEDEVETEELDVFKDKEKQINYLRQALERLKERNLFLSQNQIEDKKELEEMCAFKAKHKVKTIKKAALTNNVSNSNHQKEPLKFSVSVSTSSGPVNIRESEIRLIGLISTFLNIHRYGASIECICSYLQQIDSTVTSHDVKSLMKCFPSVFNETSAGEIDTSLVKKWSFSATTKES